MDHPAEDVLVRLLLGLTSRQESRQVVRHLLARCPTCAAALRTMKPEPPVDPGAYDETLDRFATRLRALAEEAKPGPRRAPANLLAVL